MPSKLLSSKDSHGNTDREELDSDVSDKMNEKATIRHTESQATTQIIGRAAPRKTGIIHIWDLPDRVTVSVSSKMAQKLVNGAVQKAGSRTRLALILEEKLKSRQFVTLKRLEKGNLVPLGFLRKLLRFLDRPERVIENCVSLISIYPRGNKIISPKLPFDFRSDDGLRFISAILGDGTHTRQLGYSKGKAISDIEARRAKMRVVRSMENVVGKVQAQKSWDAKVRQCSFNFPKVAQEIIGCLIPKGDKTKLNISIPDFVFDCDQRSIGVFLSQFFDDEGHCDGKRKQISLKLAVSLDHCSLVADRLRHWRSLAEREKKELVRYAPRLLLDTTKLLDKIGIRCRDLSFAGFGRNKKGTITSACWKVYVTYKRNIEAFYQKVNFGLTYKKKILESMIKGYMQDRFSGQELPKEYLRASYITQLEKGFITASGIAETVGRSYSRCHSILSELERAGLVQKVEEKHYIGFGGKGRLSGSTSKKYMMTDKGFQKLTVVMTGGVFDVIHPGHLTTLNEAKTFGDVLVVVVARNETVRRLKGRDPINDDENRLRVVKSLKPVDFAVLGDDKDMYKTVKLIKPSVIALGYDQKHDESEMRDKLKVMGLATKVVRLSVKVPGIKTSHIMTSLIDNYEL